MGAVGMYGGSFDPPHAGHIRDAAQAAQALGLERLVLIPVAVAPHKAAHTDAASGADRLAMLALSVAHTPGLEVSDLELRRQGPSYTVDTLEQLRQAYPGQELVLLMGTDMFLSFGSWYRAGDICTMARLAVMRRGDPGEQPKLLAQKQALERELGARVSLVDNAPLAVSSTQVRRLLAFRCAGEYLMPGVEAYIRERGLYGTGRSLKDLPMPELEAAVLPLMDPKRRAHVLGCRDTARALAEKWGADPELAARAGLPARYYQGPDRRAAGGPVPGLQRRRAGKSGTRKDPPRLYRQSGGGADLRGAPGGVQRHPVPHHRPGGDDAPGGDSVYCGFYRAQPGLPRGGGAAAGYG